LPFIPIAVASVAEKLSAHLLTEAAAMYAIAIGLSTRFVPIFVLAILTSLLEVGLFGVTLGSEGTRVPEAIWNVTQASILFFCSWHLLARVYLHLGKGRQYSVLGLSLQPTLEGPAKG